MGTSTHNNIHVSTGWIHLHTITYMFLLDGYIYTQQHTYFYWMGNLYITTYMFLLDVYIYTQQHTCFYWIGTSTHNNIHASTGCVHLHTTTYMFLLDVYIYT